jgi:hypothetical protein
MKYASRTLSAALIVGASALPLQFADAWSGPWGGNMFGMDMGQSTGGGGWGGPGYGGWGGPGYGGWGGPGYGGWGGYPGYGGYGYPGYGGYGYPAAPAAPAPAPATR